MRNKIKNIGIIALAVISITSCQKESFTTTASDGNYENGYFITNEGNFGTGNGSISFISNEGDVENDVFSQINSFILGDVVQSMNIINDKGYIIVNNSSKIEVTSIDSMNSITTIQGLISPRYIVKVSDEKAYVSDWGINGVHVIDLNSNTIITTITTGTGPEEIAISNGQAYVCNVGGWGLDNTISVIDIESDLVSSTIEVGDKPNSCVVDVNGDVWILTGGYTEYDANWNIISETAGVLAKINSYTNTIDVSYNFEVGNHPEDLVINSNGDKLYFSDGSWSKSVFEFNITASSLPTEAIINRSFYDLAYNNGYIFGSDAVDYVQNGWSYQYNESGILIDSMQVGIIPGGYCFN
tara:strand:+ start:2749 stop:3813 length:1065 start_codon:yes stop_codon:yes gene_type:complete